MGVCSERCRGEVFESSELEDEKKLKKNVSIQKKKKTENMR